MRLLQLFMREDGQSVTEYGLILSLFVVAVIWALIILGPKITSLFSDFNDQVN